MLLRADRLAETPTFTAYTFDDWGARILQVADIRLRRNPGQGQGGDGDDESGRAVPLTLMHTHMTFPHANEHDPPMRLQQARKISELLCASRSPGDAACLFGDLNGDADDPATEALTSIGGLRPMPPIEGGGRWVSHIAHTGKEMACDHVLTRGACQVRSWLLGGTFEELAGGRMPSDHRPVHATLNLG
jgi:endonuclease/exonuclease/phosphatase family metal-dependent hydrolase